MEELKKIDKRESIKVVTKNELITCRDLADLSLNARKLFYLAMAQCRKDDQEFYEYKTTPAELADLWGVDRSNVYREADKITDELMKIVLKIKPNEEKSKRFKKYHLFDVCEYDDNSEVLFKLHKDMTDMLLRISGNYSQPIMYEFMRMRSPYSMAVWHLMQKEMGSQKPWGMRSIEFDISLEELRKVTGAENKLKQIGEFKKRVLDKALLEIRKNCCVAITYTNIKRGRVVTGFRFTAKSLLGSRNLDEMSMRTRMKARKWDLGQKVKSGTATREEFDEYQKLVLELDQMSLDDYDRNGNPIEGGNI